MSITDELLERRVITDTGCWELRGQSHRRYGQIRDRVYVHRLAYETWVGPIPAGMLVRHRCDNPPCFNPDHLEMGGKRENLLDAAARGLWNPSPRRDSCHRGHPLTGANIYIRPDGRRECWSCRQIATAKGNAKRRGQASEVQDREAVERLAEAIG